MSKHTSGKWRVKDNHISEAMIVETCSGEEICLVEPFYNQELANANLIASAPELLEACKRVVEFNAIHENGYSRVISKATFEKIQQAILKAEGV